LFLFFLETFPTEKAPLVLFIFSSPTATLEANGGCGVVSPWHYFFTAYANWLVFFIFDASDNG
jgi:hypothetical protein